MATERRLVTKEWYNYPPFEQVLEALWISPEPEWKSSFTRERLMDVINSGKLGESLIATYSPTSGKVEEILREYQESGKIWIDVQNLCYHYSWQNPDGNYRSRVQMLEYMGGRGATSTYRLCENVFGAQ